MTSIRKAFIMAAGGGTRMRPLTCGLPKPMLPVAGKPIVQWTLESLAELGVTDVTLLLGWKSKAIRTAFGGGEDFGLDISYLHQEERMGTAHAVSMARKTMTEPFLCLSGDVIVSKEGIAGLMETYERQGTHIMGLATVKHPERYGVVTLKGDEVNGIIEKPSVPPTDTVNAGTYVFTPSIFRYIERTPLSKRGEYELTDSLMLVAREEGLPVHRLGDRWRDVARPWDLLDVNAWLLSSTESRIDGTVEDGVIYDDVLVVEKGARVKSGTYIEGPLFVGKDSVVGPNTYLRGSTSIGPGSKVGSFCEVKNSIIMAGSKIPHHSYVGDSVIGSGCNLGSGTKVANLRLDGKEIRVRMAEGWVPTGRRKLGVIMGDGVKTGINSVIDCGTVVSEGTFIGPGRRVSGYLSPGSRML